MIVAVQRRNKKMQDPVRICIVGVGQIGKCI